MTCESCISGDCWQADINWETFLVESSVIPAADMLEEPDFEDKPDVPDVLLAMGPKDPLVHTHEIAGNREPEPQGRPQLAVEGFVAIFTIAALASVLVMAGI